MWQVSGPLLKYKKSTRCGRKILKGKGGLKMPGSQTDVGKDDFRDNAVLIQLYPKNQETDQMEGKTPIDNTSSKPNDAAEDDSPIHEEFCLA